MGFFKDDFDYSNSHLGPDYGRNGIEFLSTGESMGSASFYEIAALEDSTTITGVFSGTTYGSAVGIPTGLAIRADITALRCITGSLVGYVDNE